VGFQERWPSGVRVARRGRVDPVLFENVGNRAASNLMSQIGHRALDARVSPRRILERHTHNEVDDRRHHARPTWTRSVTIRPLARNQMPIPTQQGVRRDQSVKLAQQFAPERVRLSGQPAAFGIGKTKVLPTQACFEYAVLLLQILDDIQLMAVKPTGEHQ
jgi:hypothetical protein